MIVLRIKKNTREQNKEWMEHCAPHWPGLHHSFMRSYQPGLFLSWVEKDLEGCHGPCASHEWSATRALPSTHFDTKEEAMEFWDEHALGDIIPECVRVTVEVL